MKKHVKWTPTIHVRFIGDSDSHEDDMADKEHDPAAFIEVARELSVAFAQDKKPYDVWELLRNIKHDRFQKQAKHVALRNLRSSVLVAIGDKRRLKHVWRALHDSKNTHALFEELILVLDRLFITFQRKNANVYHFGTKGSMAVAVMVTEASLEITVGFFHSGINQLVLHEVVQTAGELREEVTKKLKGYRTSAFMYDARVFLIRECRFTSVPGTLDTFQLRDMVVKVTRDGTKLTFHVNTHLKFTCAGMANVRSLFRDIILE